MTYLQRFLCRSSAVKSGHITINHGRFLQSFTEHHGAATCDLNPNDCNHLEGQWRNVRFELKWWRLRGKLYSLFNLLAKGSSYRLPRCARHDCWWWMIMWRLPLPESIRAVFDREWLFLFSAAPHSLTVSTQSTFREMPLNLCSALLLLLIADLEKFLVYFTHSDDRGERGTQPRNRVTVVGPLMI